MAVSGVSNLANATDAANAVGWREAVIAYIRAEARPADKFGHQPRLYELTREIALRDAPECDDDVLFASAYMHDLGVFVGHRPADPVELGRWDHVPYTILKCRELLPAWGFPEEKLSAVEEAIRTHQPKDDPQMTEAVVLRDADILEQLGAVGALRALVKVGRDTRYATYSEVVPVLDLAVRELPGKLRLASSREFARPRVAVLEGLLTAIREEAGGLLY